MTRKLRIIWAKVRIVGFLLSVVNTAEAVSTMRLDQNAYEISHGQWGAYSPGEIDDYLNNVHNRKQAANAYMQAIIDWTPDRLAVPAGTTYTFPFEDYESGTGQFGDNKWADFWKGAGQCFCLGFYAGLSQEAFAYKAPKTTRWGPATGQGPLTKDVVSTFRGGSYTEAVTGKATTLYRVHGGRANAVGPYWTRTKPAGSLQSRIDSALKPSWCNTATDMSTIRVPSGTTIFEGVAAPQGGLLGGGNQVYIPQVDSSWNVR